jgi:hypothetical protein
MNQSERSVASEKKVEEKVVNGNVLLFYSFDIGDKIDLYKIEKKGLVLKHETPQSHYFKDYHMPLSFRLLEKNNGKTLERDDAVLNKIHHFGVLSFCYKIPFKDSFDQLKKKVITVKEEYDVKSEIDAKRVFKAINPTISKPHFYNLKNDYFAIHVNPLPGKITAADFQEQYEGKIASLLRLETQSLSDYQQDEILSSITGYYGEDLIIIDSEASFIYDDEFFEPMEFIESATVQQLELQYYDRILDKRLNYFYQQEHHKIPFKSYIPLIGSRIESPATVLARLRVDISVVTERLENSIKMTGDAYFSRLYDMLEEKLALWNWRDSINRKLEILGDLRQVYSHRLGAIRDEILTTVIIILIALEVVLAVVR